MSDTKVLRQKARHLRALSSLTRDAHREKVYQALAEDCEVAVAKVEPAENRGAPV